ncbi:stage II sporulation protein M [Anaeromyxobacter oryzae]|uniref:Membrane protein n=1 Tax=Anaeromyxobacter oryzae TaxID=2918170 RepID=A0ABN6MXR5_9BACT|nr:stage II sporulation protein M [Anaeromyxobacter oryzae]BDG04582.1 membrane protein [Anaeromyxobacter oryzae]
MTVALKSAAFRAEREASWRELEALVAAVEKGGVGALDPRALARLPALYRAALSSLSVARAISLDRNVLDYLESLCGRSYLAVYGTRRHLRDALADFFVRRFPRAVRAHRWHLLVSWALILAGAVAGFALTRADPERFYAFVDAAYAQGRGPASSTESLREVLYAHDEGAARMLKTFAMFLFSNNARVGLLCFAIGFAGAVPAGLLLFSNGLVLGAFGALYHSRGLSLDFWGWILPHGITELTAVALCGAAGLAIGQALVFPGREERLAGLARRGRDAGVLALGAVALFFCAALVEGLFRQLVHAVPVRYAVALGSLGVLYAYLFTSGRADR